MRTFIAIDISDEIREALARIISHLKYAGADVKWVDPGNIHLTLKFLGEVSEEKSRLVMESIDGIAASVRPFEITVKDIGAFPRVENPRIIWARLDSGVGESRQLARVVEEAMSVLGFEREARQFEPHLTIGRVKSARNIEDLAAKIGAYDSPRFPLLPPHLIDSIALFRSTLTPKGSLYTKIHEAKFYK